MDYDIKWIRSDEWGGGWREEFGKKERNQEKEREKEKERKRKNKEKDKIESQQKIKGHTMIDY